MNEEILKRVTTVLCEHLGVKPAEVTPDADIINDLGADSLDQMELVMYFEEEFEMDIPDEASDGFTSVRKIVTYLEEAGAKTRGEQ